MHVCVFLYAALLFFLLTPGVLLALPPGGSLLAKAGVHALVFGLIYCMTHKAVERAMGVFHY